MCCRNTSPQRPDRNLINQDQYYSELSLSFQLSSSIASLLSACLWLPTSFISANVLSTKRSAHKSVPPSWLPTNASTIQDVHLQKEGREGGNLGSQMCWFRWKNWVQGEEPTAICRAQISGWPFPLTTVQINYNHHISSPGSINHFDYKVMC